MIKIANFYPAQLNNNSDGGNLRALVHRIEARGLQAKVREISLGPIESLDQVDIILLNSGLNSSLPLLADDLIEHKLEHLKSALARGTSVLAIASGFYFLGKKIHLGEQSFSGAGILPLEYRESNQRHVGNTIVSFSDLEKPLVGFANHRGDVLLEDGASAFAQVIKGYGNDQEGTLEGCRLGNIWATHLHGPLLIYNPHFADYILAKTPAAKNLDLNQKDMDDEAEWQAHEKIKERAMVQ
ncbi:MAG: hypothetical protein GX138_06395 [Firmicutes bacterium]|jgi:CobQ-like glutamine amidotransferase family enzyme|nr:hypothetical protein [Bacillota bacterium]